MSINQTFDKQAILHVCQVLFLTSFFPCVAIVLNFLSMNSLKIITTRSYSLTFVFWLNDP